MLSDSMIAGGGLGAGYPIDSAIKLDASSNQYLTWTPPSVSATRRKGVIAFRLKIGDTGDGTIFAARQHSSYTTTVRIVSGKLRFYTNDTTGGSFIDTVVSIRDHAGWYVEVSVEFDTTQATASDRVTIRINGEVQAVTGTYPDLNEDTWLGSGYAHAIGNNTALGDYFDGTLAEVLYAEGATYADLTYVYASGTPVPVRPTVSSWGTNGFYLTDATGTDQSGNGNNWTPVNAPETVTDTPTNNHSTMDPLWPSSSTLTNANRTAAGANRSTIPASEIASYWERTANAPGVSGGVISDTGTANTVSIPSGSTYGFRLSASGDLDYTTDGSTWTSIATGLTGQQFAYGTGGSNSVAFEEADWTYTAPTGFKALCTDNIGTSTTISSGTFTGNASAGGPVIWMGGTPQDGTVTLNGNAATRGTHYDALATGIKIRTSSTTYNPKTTGVAWTATIETPFVESGVEQTAQEN